MTGRWPIPLESTAATSDDWFEATAPRWTRTGTTMNERTPTSPNGLSLVTGPGRTPLTRRQVNALGQLLGTVPASHRGR
ncbi:MAG: hypothetical protein AAGC53_05795 [Actinomycetota bacterium]